MADVNQQLKDFAAQVTSTLTKVGDDVGQIASTVTNIAADETNLLAQITDLKNQLGNFQLDPATQSALDSVSALAATQEASLKSAATQLQAVADSVPDKVATPIVP